jgi:NitT/TauT family transport system substrate-binding protein
MHRRRFLQLSLAASLFDSRELPDTIFDVLAVTHRAEGRQPGPIKDLVAGHFAGYRYLVRNLHDAVYRIATRQGMAPELIRQALATVMLPDLAASQQFLPRRAE